MLVRNIHVLVMDLTASAKIIAIRKVLVTDIHVVVTIILKFILIVLLVLEYVVP